MLTLTDSCSQPQILIKNFQNEVTKKLPPPNPSTDGMFFAGTSGRLLLSSEDRMTLFDTQSRMTLAELQVPRIKYVVWSGDYNHVALLSKHGEGGGRPQHRLGSASAKPY